MEHPTTDLIAYLQGELSAGERGGLEAHLASCPDCRRERDAFAAILTALRASAPGPPGLQWVRWPAEVRGRLAAPRESQRRWWRPVPVAMSVGLAAAVLAVAWLGGEHRAPNPDVASLEEVIGEGLDVEPLEDLDVIQQLDGLTARGEG